MKPKHCWDWLHSVFRPKRPVGFQMGLIDEIVYWKRRAERLNGTYSSNDPETVRWSEGVLEYQLSRHEYSQYDRSWV